MHIPPFVRDIVKFFFCYKKWWPSGQPLRQKESNMSISPLHEAFFTSWGSNQRHPITKIILAAFAPLARLACFHRTTPHGYLVVSLCTPKRLGIKSIILSKEKIYKCPNATTNKKTKKVPDQMRLCGTNSPRLGLESLSTRSPSMQHYPTYVCDKCSKLISAKDTTWSPMKWHLLILFIISFMQLLLYIYSSS